MVCEFLKSENQWSDLTETAFQVLTYYSKPSSVTTTFISSFFNSFIAKQWMSFCGEGENGVSRR